LRRNICRGGPIAEMAVVGQPLHIKASVRFTFAR
jgi:hypothetical protein